MKMIDNDCHAYSELLVDYSDGELDRADAVRVQEHLAQCAACRDQVRWLRVSLDAAQTAWRDAAEGQVDAPAAEDAVHASAASTQRNHFKLLAAAAAVIALAAGAWWMISRGIDADRPTVELVNELDRKSDGTVDSVDPALAENTPAGDSPDVRQMIQQQAQSARLAAAARILAEAPGLKDYEQQAQSYLISAYGAPSDNPHPAN